MGAVYEAVHPEIGRRVAIKVLRGEFSGDPQLLGRFLNEARAANAIKHPNIIEILDSGTTDNGKPYLVMELLEGETLSGHIKRVGKLTLGDALEFAYQTASAVGAAHKKGIVHRDLKPDNLFLVADETDQGRQRIKVLDFGIAKLQQTAKGDSVKTRTGTLMGTPVYMSPEQCLGTKDVDHRSDVYALGVILHEMLCGRPPFVSEGFGELVNMHLNLPPPGVRGDVPSLPAAIENAVLRMLAKKPEDRFNSMADVQAALKVAGGPSLMIRGSSSPDLTGGTMPAMNAVAPTKASLAVAPTTLSTGVGERGGTTQRVNPGRQRVAALVVVTVAVVGLGAWWVVGRGTSETKSTATATQPTFAASGPVVPSAMAGGAGGETGVAAGVVTLKVNTHPPGARLLRAGDGVLLGVTPLALEMKAAGTPLEVRIEKEGFTTVTRSLSLERDVTDDVVLEKKKDEHRGGKKPAPRRGDDEPAKL